MTEGVKFDGAPVEEVYKFLLTRDIQVIPMHTRKMYFTVSNDQLILETCNRNFDRCQVRKAFVLKLLNWFNFPHFPILRFDGDAFTSVLNNLLYLIDKEVKLAYEDGEALTILSRQHSITEDLALLKLCRGFPINNISRNDFMTRFFFREVTRISPRIGDDIGCGFHLLNSETGFRALEMHAYLLRLASLNVAVHSVSLPGLQQKSSLHGLDWNEMEHYVKGFVREAGAHFGEIEKKLRLCTMIPADETPGSILSRMNHAHDSKRKDDYVYGFHRKYGKEATLYDLYNYLTETAKGLDPIEGLMLQQLAGEVAEKAMPGSNKN
jgi:hypothetical protein